MRTTAVTVETPRGQGRFLLDSADEPRAILLLGHGAGGGPNAMDLELLARQLPERGITVARFEQPWRTAGRRVAGSPATLDEAWLAAIDWLISRLPKVVEGRSSALRLAQDSDRVPRPLLVGGRSAGARVACRTANVVQPVGIVCLAFPLHLPGRPDTSRVAELLAPAAPRLVIQGSADAFGTPAEIREATGRTPEIRVVELPGADHGFRVATSSVFTPADLRDAVVDEVSGFIESRLGIPTS